MSARARPEKHHKPGFVAQAGRPSLTPAVALFRESRAGASLLDVAGAVEALPTLSLGGREAAQREVAAGNSGRDSGDRRTHQATVTSTGSPTRM
jgi:hypothetical protein